MALLCFHCSCEILNIYRMPVEYDRQLNEYVTYGNFCSVECMKSFNVHSNDSYKHNRFSLITNMYNLHNVQVNCAPPREALKQFGGTLTMKEFKNKNRKFSNLNIPPMRKLEIQTDGENDLSSVNNFTWVNSSDAKEESKILQRESPVKNKNTLDKIMNIQKK